MNNLLFVIGPIITVLALYIAASNYKARNSKKHLVYMLPYILMVIGILSFVVDVISLKVFGLDNGPNILTPIVATVYFGGLVLFFVGMAWFIFNLFVNHKK